MPITIIVASPARRIWASSAWLGPSGELPITLGTVLRGNRLTTTPALLWATGMSAGDPLPGAQTDPLVKDVIVEDNLVENNGVGVCVCRTATAPCCEITTSTTSGSPCGTKPRSSPPKSSEIKELLAERTGGRLGRR